MAVPRGRFRREQRVRKSAEYQPIMARGIRVATPCSVLVLFRRSEEAGTSSKARLGLIVSRKVGKAVERNRMKRMIREAFRATRALWPSDIDLVVIARPYPADLKMQDLVEHWHKARPRLERALASGSSQRANSSRPRGSSSETEGTRC